MLQTSAPQITRHDYQEMKEGPPYYQVIEGDLVMSPSPNTFHQQIVLEIGYAIRSYLEKHPIGTLFIAPLDVFLTETNVYQPDIIFVSNERRHAIIDVGIEGTPDFIVEVLSPGTAAYDRGSKRKIYARTGVEELWLVDPEKLQIQIFHLQEDPETPAATHSANSVFSSRMLPGLKFKGKRIFRR